MESFTENLKCVQCAQTRPIADLTLCSGCGHNNVPRLYYCWSHCRENSCGHARNCDLEGHLSCWRGVHSAFPPLLQEHHQKLNALHDGCIQVIMPPKVDDETQRRLHEADREAEWFRVTLATLTPQGAEPLLQISDRFRKSCNPGRGNYWSLQQYPSLVSFIGDTGVGKSTLVRAMLTIGVIEEMVKSAQVDWTNLFNCQTYGPVARTTSAKLAMLPTSVGVHLYRDQTLLKVPMDAGSVEDVPILFADCEGFSAGSMITDAERSTLTEVRSTSSRQRSGSSPSQNPLINREIVIKAPEFKDKGKESAELFYARFLYAFSDVVVFVVNEDQKMKREMQRLLEWAVSAVKSSVNRNSPKTLLVVRNAPRMHDDNFYDDTDLKNDMFRHFGQVWDDSKILTDYKGAHDDKCTRWGDKIHNNEDYFGLFFRQTTICYIPSTQNASATRLYGQYRHLRQVVVDGVLIGQQVRSNSWTRYDVPSMTHLLNRAFEHFAEFDKPFDFHTAARKDNPTPISIPGHVANLLRHLGTTAEQLENFEIIVAVCLVTYIYRSFDFGREPVDLFEELLEEKCVKGIEIYQAQFLRCALKMEDGTTCVNYAHNHAIQHCSEKNLIWNGPIDTRGFAKAKSDVVLAIKRSFIAMYQELYAVPKNQNRPMLHDISRYRRVILGHTRRKPSTPGVVRVRTIKAADFAHRNDIWVSAKSNMSCFACLQYGPDHVLPCGHGFCEECVKDFGTVSLQQPYHYGFVECILCGTTEGQWLEQLRDQRPSAALASSQLSQQRPNPQPSVPQVVRLNPRCSGIRVLTLDGGGIKGIVEIAILEIIERRVGLKVPIRDLFDLIVGTSTGGIISLALTMAPKDMTLQQIRQQFLALAKETFEKDRFNVLSYLDPLEIFDRSKTAAIAMFLRFVPSRYKSRNLRSSLLKFFDERQPIFGDATVTGKQRRTRVAVTTTNDGEPCIFSNYSRTSYDREDHSDDDHLVKNKGFERQNNPSQEARVWEAAMATSAAPGFFHEWRIDDPEKRRQDKVPFVDGALHSNLPVEYALEEKERIWPKHQGYSNPLDLLVSVGSGRQPGEIHIPGWMNFANAGEAAKAYMKKVFNTDSVWHAFTRSRNFDPGHHFRLTVDLEKRVSLDNWQEMEGLGQVVNEEYEKSKVTKAPGGLWQKIETVAYHLTAGMLFFEPESIDSRMLRSGRRQEIITGHIWCRLDTPSPAIRSLINRIEGLYHQEGSRQPTPFQLDSGWKQTLRSRERSGQPFKVPCNLGSAEDPNVPQSVVVSLLPPQEVGAPTPVAISGFPVTFDQMKAGLKQRGVQ